MNEIELTTPFAINAAREIRIGYRVVNQQGFPVGYDSGPAVAGKGDLLQSPSIQSGQWISATESLSGWNYNFSIKAFVTNSDDKVVKTLSSADSRALSGHNIYRLTPGQSEDVWSLLAENVTESAYTDETWATLATGNYQFAVKSKFGSGISEAVFSNELEKQVSIESLEISAGFTLYPNPVRDILKIVRPTVDNARIEIYNSIGSLVQTFEIENIEHELNVSTFSSGIYLIRLIDEQGSSVLRFVKE